MKDFNDFDIPETKGEFLDGGKCECAICGKKKKLGGVINPVPGMKEQIHKIICIDCTLEESALRHGLTKKEAAKRRKQMFEAFYAFQEVMFERYLKENNKKEFKSIEEANEVLDFVQSCWNKIPKKFHKITDTLEKQELKNIFKSLSFDFRTFKNTTTKR